MLLCTAFVFFASACSIMYFLKNDGNYKIYVCLDWKN
jgi:hypothetical protein